MSPIGSESFRRAFDLHRRGLLAQAEALYEEALGAQPRHAEALHLLGVLSGQTQRYERAAELIGRALAIAPDNAAAHRNRASALKALGQLDAALAHCDRAVALEPDSADAHANRAVLQAAVGRSEAALASYGRALALNPDHADSFYNRANLLASMGRLEAALADQERAVALKPAFAEAWYNRANLLRSLGRSAAALASYDQAIAVKPDYADAHGNRGFALEDLGRHEAALASHDRALELRPDRAETHCNRAKVLIAMNRAAEALQSCDRALAIDARHAGALCNRGVILKEMGLLDAALDHYGRALAVQPDYAEAHLNRGVTLQQQNRCAEAMAAYDAAIAARPDHAEAHLDRAMLRLLLGDYERGWAEYEWRWQSSDGRKLRALQGFAQPAWNGEDSLAGRTVLLYGEQGLGDTLQFCRYVAQVAALGATVILQVPKPLERLLARLPGVTSVIAQTDTPPRFDHHVSLMSLPALCRTTVATIPARVPYLEADPADVAGWAARLGRRSCPRVGLVWSGGFRPGQPEVRSVNERRNIPLAELAPLRHAGVEFHSLQKGEVAEAELARLQATGWDGPQLLDATSRLGDFADTAALITNLDLVISVDTSTAHLAGALGKPVWLLNRFDTCWRWLLERDDSPWYPTAKLYRQRAPDAWHEVVARVAHDLCEWARSAQPA